VRIPGGGDRQFQAIMIAIPGLIVIRIPGEDDHQFRGDRDRLIAIFGTVIPMP
jgi:hypothetical protein